MSTRVEPGVELANVGFQGDASQPPKDPQAVIPERWRQVAQLHLSTSKTCARTTVARQYISTDAADCQ